MKRRQKVKELRVGFLYADFNEINRDTTILRYDHSDNEFDYFTYFSGEKWQKFEDGFFKSPKSSTWFQVPFKYYPVDYLRNLGY